MARCFMLLAALGLAMCEAFVVPVKSPSQPATPRRLPSRMETVEAPSDASAAGQAVVLSMLAGLIVGLAAPSSSWAEDAAAPAVSPKEARAAKFKEEMQKASAKLQAAPSKEERLKKSQQQLQEYSKKADTEYTSP